MNADVKHIKNAIVQKYRAVPFSKAEMDELVGNSVRKHHGVSDILTGNDDCGLDFGWILPDGRQVLMSYQWDGYHYNALLCLKDRVARISREFGTVDLIDGDGTYESAMTYDALTNGLVRFCLNGDSQYIETGRTLTRAQLGALYDLEEFVLKSESVAEADADGDFDLHVDIGAYIDADKKYHRPSASLAYRSVDEFRRRFINDVRRNVRIAEMAVSESIKGGLPITDLGKVFRLDSC